MQVRHAFRGACRLTCAIYAKVQSTRNCEEEDEKGEGVTSYLRDVRQDHLLAAVRPQHAHALAARRARRRRPRLRAV